MMSQMETDVLMIHSNRPFPEEQITLRVPCRAME